MLFEWWYIRASSSPRLGWSAGPRAYRERSLGRSGEAQLLEWAAISVETSAPMFASIDAAVG